MTLRKMLLALLALAVGAVGQSTTFSVQAFNAVTTAGPSAIFRNIGQSSHWLTYCAGSGLTSLQIQIEASEDHGATWFAISDVGSNTTGCAVLQGSGYFDEVRADILAIAGGSVTAYYSASVYPVASGGIVKGGTAARPVALIPNASWINDALLSTSQTISSNATVVGGIEAYNPNTSVVYLVLTDNGTPVVVHPIAAGAESSIALSAGVYTVTNLAAYCTTSLSTPTAPATGCVVDVFYKPLVFLANEITINGTVVHYSNSPSNGLY